jgi:hypothetical protein
MVSSVPPLETIQVEITVLFLAPNVMGASLDMACKSSAVTYSLR